MLARLEAIEHPTVDERVALWLARVYRAYLDDTIRKSKIAEAVRAWRQIVDEYPTHVGALFLLAASVESDESIELFRKVIELDPSHIIAIDLIVRLLVRTDSSENQQEALDYLQLGFEHSEGIQHVRFGTLIYKNHLKAQKHMSAGRIRLQMQAELEEARQTLDRTTALKLICRGDVFYLELGSICLDFISASADSDRQGAKSYGDDLISAMEQVLHITDVHGTRSVDHYIFVRDLLDSAYPESSKSSLFYRVYSMLVGPEKQVDLLEKAVELDPTDGKAALSLGGALERRGRSEEARNVYLNVTQYEDSNWSGAAKSRLNRMSESSNDSR